MSVRIPKYRRLIAEFVSNDGTISPSLQEGTLTVNKLILQYFRFAKTYYVKNGKQADEIAALRAVLRRLRKLYGQTLAAEFGPKAYKTLRESLIQEKLSRKYINDCMGRVRRMFHLVHEHRRSYCGIWRVTHNHIAFNPVTRKLNASLKGIIQELHQCHMAIVQEQIELTS